MRANEVILQISRMAVEPRLHRNFHPSSDILLVKRPVVDAVRCGFGPDRLLDNARVSRR